MNHSLLNSLGVIILYVTHRCNLKCEYCLNNFNGSKEHTVTDLDQNDNYLNNLYGFVDSIAKKDVYLSFFGGEPTIKWDTCKEIYDYGRNHSKKNMHFNIQTNGTLLGELYEDIRKMDDLNICISMDGNKEAHDKYRIYHDDNGSWQDIRNNIQFYVKKGLTDKLSVAITYYPAEADKLTERVKAIYDMGVKTVRATVIKEVRTTENDIGNVKKSYQDLTDFLVEHPDHAFANLNRFAICNECFNNEYDLYKKKTWIGACRAGAHKVFINTNGDIFPCSTMMGREYFLGNIFTGEMNDRLAKAINNHYDKNCYHCEFSEGCQMCIYRMSLESGTIYTCSDFMKKYCKMKCDVLDEFYGKINDKYDINKVGD